MTSLNAIVGAAGVRTRGRAARPLVAYVDSHLTPEDLSKLGEARNSTTPSVKSIRQYHHQIARLLAQGLKPGSVSAITGVSLSRISILQNDPSFAELLVYYKGMEAEQYDLARADVHEKLSALGFDAMETLHERLMDEPEKFAVDDLRKIVEMSADRTGYGKTSTVNSNLSVGLDDKTLALIRTGQAPASANPSASTSRDDLLRIARQQTLLHSPTEETSGTGGEGEGVRAEDPQELEGEFSVVEPGLDRVD